eukprot:TRINITY_DN22870_c0_g1_i1.p1 TRINITY_DN22870_c0_g1~~TRINITY_DN22870_c0_g1_i1.p1  ORF type:complete len:274 (+),score=54.11 TRINITY_DN22870_c0_g1_i1:57-878(+)
MSARRRLPLLLLLRLSLPVCAGHAPTNVADWLWWKLGMLPDWDDHDAASEIIPTTLGDLQARTFGTRGRPVALAIHGGTNHYFGHREFDATAGTLVSELGYYVVCPVFHSLRAAKPGTISDATMQALLVEILRWAGAKKYEMLLGKAWGGAMVGRFAAAAPEYVDKLVLVAPGLLRENVGKDSSFTIDVPSLLLWAGDDSSVNRRIIENVQQSLTQPFNGGKQIWNNRGGNKVLTMYISEILTFAKSRPLSAEASEHLTLPDSSSASVHAEEL